MYKILLDRWTEKLRFVTILYVGVFEKEGPKELEDAGKAGLVTIQGQFSKVLGAVLVCKFLIVSLLFQCMALCACHSYETSVCVKQLCYYG